MNTSVTGSVARPSPSLFMRGSSWKICARSSVGSSRRSSVCRTSRNSAGVSQHSKNDFCPQLCSRANICAPDRVASGRRCRSTPRKGFSLHRSCGQIRTSAANVLAWQACHPVASTFQFENSESFPFSAPYDASSTRSTIHSQENQRAHSVPFSLKTWLMNCQPT